MSNYWRSKPRTRVTYKNRSVYMEYAGADYLTRIMDPVHLGAIVQRSLPQIRKLRRKLGFEALATTGVSGLMFSSIVSVKLEIPLIVVRPVGSKCHSPNRVEGVTNVERYAIVDDFMQSGATAERIIRLVRQHNPDTQAVAVLLYENFPSFTTEWASLPVYGLNNSRQRKR